MRVDKAINHNKVAKDVLLNPLKTQRDRAEDLWLWKTTIQEHLQDLEKSWFLKEAIRKYEEQQQVLCNDFKKEIDNELLSQFITLTWSKTEATKQIEDFLMLSIEWTKRKRKWITDNTRYWLLHNAWFKCQACWVKPKPDNDIELEIDHIIPFTQWWICIEWNYQVLCKSCNCSKKNEFIYNHNTNE